MINRQQRRAAERARSKTLKVDAVKVLATARADLGFAVGTLRGVLERAERLYVARGQSLRGGTVAEALRTLAARLATERAEDLDARTYRELAEVAELHGLTWTAIDGANASWGCA